MLSSGTSNLMPVKATAMVQSSGVGSFSRRAGPVASTTSLKPQVYNRQRESYEGNHEK
jgi:hypothetical protein